ncbi:expressed unknown protein [Seminavis robusta]|uniref:Uncharacterized protein n=1 Tax=Seminavis robusta TaxID=568900 RepID=A0A9N8E513_9STRA|nr:expressed unknown protein [Seminavis robusta]|eukprot:Sro508_g156670.1 n/a (389) ;mRNA; f:13960-15225
MASPTPQTSRSSSAGSSDSAAGSPSFRMKRVASNSQILAMMPSGKSCCVENSKSSHRSSAGDAAVNNTTTGNSNARGGTMMHETSNVLLQYTLQDLDRRAECNFWLGLICLGVCAVNVVLVYLNYVLKHAHPPPQVSHRTFHLLEFWTSCIYAIAETFALVMSPKTMLHIYKKPNLLKLLLFFNVVNSMVPALLMTLDFEYFEKLCHELEFINSFTLSFITMILLASLLHLEEQPPNGVVAAVQNNTSDTQSDTSSIVMVLIACLVAACNFIVYNAHYTAAAHYLEFGFQIFVSLITFWFCMDNRFVAQMEIGQILYGRHEHCIFCQIKEQELDNANAMMMNSTSSFRFGGNNNNNNNNHDDDDNDEEMQWTEQTPLMRNNRRASSRL